MYLTSQVVNIIISRYYGEPATQRLVRHTRTLQVNINTKLKQLQVTISDCIISSSIWTRNKLLFCQLRLKVSMATHVHECHTTKQDRSIVGVEKFRPRHRSRRDPVFELLSWCSSAFLSCSAISIRIDTWAFGPLCVFCPKMLK